MSEELEAFDSPASRTALALIQSSMRLIGALAEGETPTAQEAADALVVLNDLLDAWTLEGLVLYRLKSEEFALAAGQGAYTIGPEADFDTARPVAIAQAFITEGGVDTVLAGPLAVEDWNRIPDKTTRGTPQAIHYDAAHPAGIVHLWPAPASALSLTLSMNMRFTALASTAEVISYPPGYAKALRYALAVELAPEFGVAPPAVVVETARKTLGRIKAANRRQPSATFDAALVSCGGSFLAG